MKVFIILFVILILMISCKSANKLPDIKYKLIYPENLDIVTREEWGSVADSNSIDEHKIKRITIHHGGVEFGNEKNVIDHLKHLQAWSRSDKNWINIPYHYLLDLDGNIYEGRQLKYPGDTNTDYNPNGHLLICVLGNYEIQKINDKQLGNLVNLCNYFCQELNLNPDSIKGHKDYTDTACPGKDLYKYINDGSLVTLVKKGKTNSKK